MSLRTYVEVYGWGRLESQMGKDFRDSFDAPYWVEDGGRVILNRLTLTLSESLAVGWTTL